jgi:hypothetical protein
MHHTNTLPVQHTMGKLYHRAKFSLTCRTLEDFLNQFKPNEYDESLEEPISWSNQSDMFSEIPRPLPALNSIVDILSITPVVCRTITICKPLFPGLKMNPWLTKVHNLPTIVRFMSTADFMQFKDKYHCKELINSAMLITKNPSGSILAYGVGKHISTYFLTGNPELFHPDSDLATWASVVIYILTQPTRASWMIEELDTIEKMHSYVYSEQGSSWANYLAQVESNNFRMSLVTKHHSLPLWSQCPHLNKFILAVYFLRKKLTLEQMTERRNAAIQEFFGRMYTPDILTAFYEGKYSQSVQDILDSVPLDLKSNLRETYECFRAKIDKFDFNSIDITITEPTQDTVRQSHLNLCCATILSLFKAMCPEIADLHDDEWRKLLLNGIFQQESFSRNGNSNQIFMPRNSNKKKQQDCMLFFLKCKLRYIFV